MRYDEIKKQFSLQAKPRRRPGHLESEIQRACVQWFKLQYPRYVIFAVPNGGARNGREAAIMQGEGVLAGVSDLVLVADNSVMFVEMKTPKNKQQKTQIKFQQDVERLGHTYCVCHSLNEFMLAVERWLKSKYGYEVSDK